MDNEFSAHRLFELPELLGLIFNHIDDRLLSKLLYVSRPFFRAAVPLIWEDVPGAYHLLKLIPGVEISNETQARSKTIVLINIPHGLGETTDFARFNLYAQFVKRLDVLPPDISDYYFIEGWRDLSEQAKQ
ncbi:hypothetical protein FRC08_013925 [Ceratobasidium sp. 394]|nr:hypothetical protein FRC08_013925 [Ceratobasidium sp. 394]